MGINTVIYFGCEALRYNEANQRWESANYHTAPKGNKTAIFDSSNNVVVDLLPQHPESYGAIYIPPEAREIFIFNKGDLRQIRSPFEPLQKFIGTCEAGNGSYQTAPVKLKIGTNLDGVRLEVLKGGTSEHSLKAYRVIPSGTNKYNIEFVYNNGKTYIAKDVEVKSQTGKDITVIFSFKDGVPFRIDGEFSEPTEPGISNIILVTPEIPKGLQDKLSILNRLGEEGGRWAKTIKGLYESGGLNEAAAVAQAESMIAQLRKKIPSKLQDLLDQLKSAGNTKWAETIKGLYESGVLDEAAAIAQAESILKQDKLSKLLEAVRKLPNGENWVKVLSDPNKPVDAAIAQAELLIEENKSAEPPPPDSAPAAKPEPGVGTEAGAAQKDELQDKLAALKKLPGGDVKARGIETMLQSKALDRATAIGMADGWIERLKTEKAPPPANAGPVEQPAVSAPDPRKALLEKKLQIVDKRPDGAKWREALSNEGLPIESRIAQADMLISQYLDSRLAELEKMGLEGKNSATAVRDKFYKESSWINVDDALKFIEKLIKLTGDHKEELRQKLETLRAVKDGGKEAADEIQKQVDEEKITYTTATINAQAKIDELNKPKAAPVTVEKPAGKAAEVTVKEPPPPPVVPEETGLSKTQASDVETYFRQFQGVLTFIKDSFGNDYKGLLAEVKVNYTRDKDKVLGEKSGIPKELADQLKILDDVVTKGFAYLENPNLPNLREFRAFLDTLKIDDMTVIGPKLNESIKFAIEELKGRIDKYFEGLATPQKPPEPSYQEKYEAWVKKTINDEVKESVRRACSYNSPSVSVTARYDEHGFLVLTVTFKTPKAEFDGSELDGFFEDLKAHPPYPLPWDNNFMPNEYEQYKAQEKEWLNGRYPILNVRTAYLLNYIPHKVIIKAAHECNRDEKALLTQAMQKNEMKPISVECQYDYSVKIEGSWDDFKKILQNDQRLYGGTYQLEQPLMSTEVGKHAIPKIKEFITVTIPFKKFDDFVAYLLNVIKKDNVRLGGHILFASSFDDKDEAKLAGKAHHIYTQGLQKTEVHTAPQSPFAVDGVAEIKPGYIIVYILPKGTELKVGR